MRSEFRESDPVSVEIVFDGGLDGVVVLAFSRASAEKLVETLVPGASSPDDELAVSGLKEVGNIVIGGFIDGWADYLETTIDISTPTYVEFDGDGPIDDAGPADDAVPVFRNRLEATGAAVNFQLFMLPTRASVGKVVNASDGDRTLPLSTFQSFGGLIGRAQSRPRRTSR